MLSALAWVPRGVAKAVPQVAEPTPEELELMRQGALDEDADEEPQEESEDDEEEDEWEEVDEMELAEEAEEASAEQEDSPEKPKTSTGSKSKRKKGGGKAADLASELAELDMDKYDEEEERAINLFGTGKGVGGAFYKSNEDDPYMAEEEDDDEEEKDDLTLRPSDLLLLAARNEDDVSFIELWVCEEPAEGEDDFNMYVHHDVMLPAFPLSMAWMDFNAKGPAPMTSAGAALSSSATQGNFVAVGTMNPEIEIWDLDVLDEVEPVATLGGFAAEPKKNPKQSKKSKKGKGPGAGRALKPGSHGGAVMSLAWNQEFRNVLGSGGEDTCVKIWDMAAQECQRTLTHHSGKVQAVTWCPKQPTVLLSGSFDRTVAMVDGRTPDAPCQRWLVSADVEATVWDPLNEHRFLVSTEDGHVTAFDVRTGGGDAKGLFTLAAHDKATCSMSFNPHVPHLLATGSTDKKVKLWDLKADAPKELARKNPKAGAVFSVAFCKDSPSILAIGGSEGTLHLWSVAQVKGVSSMFGGV